VTTEIEFQIISYCIFALTLAVDGFSTVIRPFIFRFALTYGLVLGLLIGIYIGLSPVRRPVA